MDLQNKIIGIIGRKGSGKSTILKELLKPERRLFVFNTMGEHSWVIDHIPDLPTVKTYLDGVADPKEHFQAEYTPLRDDVMASFDEVTGEVYDIGNMTYAIEELPMVTVSAGYMQPTLSMTFRTGRHRALNLVWTAQRASEVPRGVTAATDVFILFSQTEPGDIKKIGERCSPECASEVANLGLHDFITFDVATREVGTMEEFHDIERHHLLNTTARAEPVRASLFEEHDYGQEG